MKILTITLLCLLFPAGTALSQLETCKVKGVRHATWKDGEIRPGPAPDSGPSLWNNMAKRAWWSGPRTGYINLDWGKLPEPTSGLPDHVIDGFTFTYGTNNWDPAGESFAISFFDSCTGWGNLGIQEAGFLFSGLPNSYGGPSGLPPGYGWVWSISVDLEGTGYEFLLNEDFGMGHCRTATPLMGGSGPCAGYAPGTSGNGPTGTENAFDIYFPNLTYNGSWYFGSYPTWATWTAELFGTEGWGDMTFYGVEAPGNDAKLYATGAFAAGGSLRFLLRKNGLDLDGHLLASHSYANNYIGGVYDVTRLVGDLIPCFPKTMTDDLVGDFCVLDGIVPLHYAGGAVYIQGILGDRPLGSPPLDASNGLRAK